MTGKQFKNFGLNQQYLLSRSDPRQRAWLEVDSKAIEANTRLLKDLIGSDCNLMAVVKADGYGHGAVTVSKAALQAGAKELGVATIQEGIELRKAGLNCPILLLGNLTNANEFSYCLHWNLIPTLSSIREALLCQNLAEGTGRIFNVQLKIDTGMTRLGCNLSDVKEIVEAINSLINLNLQGVYSHLALADGDLKGKGEIVTSLQQKRFEEAIKSLSCNKKSLCFHLANSAGTLRNSRLHYNMVRVGLALYGHNPLNSSKLNYNFQPAMSVKARVTLLRTVPSGTGVGYGHTFITTRKTSLAVIGIGYADGVSRLLSGKISALYKGNLLPQVGSIAMDQLVLDITDHSDLKIGDIVTLLGHDGYQSIEIHQWSKSMGSIPWEVLCGFKNRLPRVVV
tara:strand:+ start:26738 stop:27925 length:1188 start_codon:yes stop_codon:yes gene_type:complete